MLMELSLLMTTVWRRTCTMVTKACARTCSTLKMLLLRSCPEPSACRVLFSQPPGAVLDQGMQSTCPHNTVVLDCCPPQQPCGISRRAPALASTATSTIARHAASLHHGGWRRGSRHQCRGTCRCCRGNVCRLCCCRHWATADGGKLAVCSYPSHFRALPWKRLHDSSLARHAHKHDASALRLGTRA